MVILLLFCLGSFSMKNSPYLTVYRILRCHESRCVKLDIVEQNHLQHGQNQEGGGGRGSGTPLGKSQVAIGFLINTGTQLDQLLLEGVQYGPL